MSTATATLTAAPTAAPVASRPLRRVALPFGAVAAVTTTAVAAAAGAAGVPFEIDGETIPLAGFAQLTLVGALLGGLLAWALNHYSAHPRRRFVQAAVVLTAVS